MFGGLTVYKWIVDESDDSVTMDFNSIVDNPAHGKPFITFSKDTKQAYAISDKKERVVFGVLISVGTPIYRNDNGYEYFGVFDKKAATRMKEKFMRQSLMHNVNVMHNPNKVVKGAFMTEIFQINSKTGTECPGCLKGQNLQDGTVIGAYKITDEKTWNDIESGKFRGFSIEAYLDVKPANVKKANMSKEKKGLFRIPKFFTGEPADEEEKKFATATASDGTVITWDGELAEGTPVFVEIESEQSPAPEGEHEVTLEDGTVKVITLDVDGKVVSVEDVVDMSEEGETILAAVEQTMRRHMAATDKKIEAITAENTALKAEVEALKEDRKGSKFNSTRRPVGSGSTTTKKTWTTDK